MKQSGFLERQAAAKNAVMNSTELLTKQYMIDTFCIAIHESEGWGYDRIMRLMEAWRNTREEYRLALNPKHPEADVAQEHMDRVLVQIINGKQELIPFAERYPDLKGIKYGRK